jgi:hypothetical protein
MSESRPPLRARLHWYKLTRSELAFLTAAAELMKDVELYASVSRLAAYSKLSDRQVQRIIASFTDRGVLTELAPPNAEKRRPATYRFNEEALESDPRMRRWPQAWLQRTLPGIVKPPKLGIGQPVVTDEGCDSTGDTVSLVRCQQVTRPLVTQCHQSGDTTSSNPKASDPRAFSSDPPEAQRAQLWAEKNSYTYRAFCRELEQISRASQGVYQFDHEAAALKAAYRVGVPKHIALALTREDP